MFTNEVLDTLTNIRVDMLRYWQSETNPMLKEELSKHLDALDNLILLKRRQLETLKNIGGSNGKQR